jgi:SAM-dependent methyltransferase
MNIILSLQEYIMKLQKTFVKSSIWFKISLVALIMYVIVNMFHYDNKKEYFTQREKFVVKKGDQIYDSFYVSIYDDLVYDKTKNIFEIGEISTVTKLSPKTSTLLDVGSGTGHHCKLWSSKGFNVIGLDKSKSMVEYASKKYPKLDFETGDVLDTMLYPGSSFDYIQSLYFTIYYIQDKRLFFENCYQWLKPGGYLAIHLVNRDMFDPMLDAANPLYIVSPQKYAKKRIMDSVIKFNDFQYKGKFHVHKQKNRGEFVETFKDDKTGKVRKNIHEFYMPTQKEILSYAKDSGFNLLGKIDMVTTQYEYQYIYLLQKPY